MLFFLEVAAGYIREMLNIGTENRELLLHIQLHHPARCLWFRIIPDLEMGKQFETVYRTESETKVGDGGKDLEFWERGLDLKK